MNSEQLNKKILKEIEEEQLAKALYLKATTYDLATLNSKELHPSVLNAVKSILKERGYIGIQN